MLERLRRLLRRRKWTEFGAPLPRGLAGMVGPGALEIRKRDLDDYLGPDRFRRLREPVRIFIDPATAAVKYNAGGRLVLISPVALFGMRVGQLGSRVPVLDVALLHHEGLSAQKIQKVRAEWLADVLYPSLNAGELKWADEMPGVGGSQFAHDLAEYRARAYLPDFLVPFFPW